MKYLLLLCTLAACGDPAVENKLVRYDRAQTRLEARVLALENPVVVEAPHSSVVAEPALATCNFAPHTLWFGGAEKCWSCQLEADGSFYQYPAGCSQSHFDCVGGQAVFVRGGQEREVMPVVIRSGVTRVEDKDGTGYALHNTEAECLLWLHDSAVSRVEAVALGLPATESSARVVPATRAVSPKVPHKQHRHSTIQCCDGTYSPTCTYRHRGCCSWHGGVCE